MMKLNKCEQCGKTFLASSPRQKFCTKRCRQNNEKERVKQKFVKTDQLCWDCAKYAGQCLWSSCFKPIKGWTATPVHKIDVGREVNTYSITACPEFIKG